ncbi:hypothetical protein ANAPC1_01176 [Anaplasma phagocytophilum]|uniref:Uncharacterized protein n=1 Tax=Anaplasma phagocytophilum TaxID=948 RepID=A0AA45UTP1_ANAPH|nr:hypothetical protein ANAPC1_00977 [Anaplasma phagocytophilum]SBO14718.1 hypothetical protein ANAPC1_01081 [Anaplasma phagocytophilum]SBO14807.1 hypothetical protein ANAPC1_01176 [Anaplasma phagocytophilum]
MSEVIHVLEIMPIKRLRLLFIAEKFLSKLMKEY